MIHALPVKRNELFFTNYLNGILFFIDTPDYHFFAEPVRLYCQ